MATITDESTSAANALRRAIADFDHAIQLDPSNVDAFLNRGKAYLRLGQFDRAIADFDGAIRLDPSNFAAGLNRGFAQGARSIEEDGVAGQFKMILTISAEVRELLAHLATEAGGTEFDVIGRAISLYSIAIETRKEGKGIGIFDQNLELEREITGL